MSFGGAVGAMITSMKNNKRDKNSTFKKLKNYDKSHNLLHFDKKASKEELKELRKKLRRENRIISIRNAIITVIIFTIFIYFTLFHQ